MKINKQNIFSVAWEITGREKNKMRKGIESVKKGWQGRPHWEGDI